MCGIFGFNRTTPLTQSMTGVLAICMESRGKDSWGVTDGKVIHKFPDSITSTFREFDLEAPVYHTRGASVGKVTKDNAHPFHWAGRAKEVIGVHNGHISNHADLTKKYNRAIEVDSQHIFAHLAEDKPLSELKGWGNVVWYEYPLGRPELARRYFSSFGNKSLDFVTLQSGEVVFASTIGAINLAARLASANIDIIWDTKIRKKYEIQTNPTTGVTGPVEIEELDWAIPEPVVAHGRHFVGGGGYVGNYQAHNYQSEICVIYNCSNKTAKPKDLLCAKCLKDYESLYIGVEVSAA